MTFTTIRALALAALLGIPAACAPGAERETEILGPFFFACDDGRTLTVRFDKAADTVWVLEPGKDSRVLPQTRSGSGYWYADQAYSFRGKGREAWWQEPGKPRVSCRQRAG